VYVCVCVCMCMDVYVSFCSSFKVMRSSFEEIIETGK
jgi:hypothetical protein